MFAECAPSDRGRRARTPLVNVMTTVEGRVLPPMSAPELLTQPLSTDRELRVTVEMLCHALRLAELGVYVRYTQNLEPGRAADWDRDEQTLLVSTTLTTEQRAFLLSETRRLISIGVHATRAHVDSPRPDLYLVPPPRAATT